MTIEQIEAFILFMGGEVPNTNKSGKEEVAKALAIDFLSAQPFEPAVNFEALTIEELEQLITQVQAAGDGDESTNKTNTTLNVAGENSAKPDLNVKLFSVDLPCSVDVLIDKKVHSLKAGKHSLARSVINDIKAAGIKV